MHKHYNFSDIVSNIEHAFPDNGETDSADVLTNISYLNSKNTTFNLFDDPDLYLILNFQNGGELIFQKNNHLEVDGSRILILELMSLIDDERIKTDAITDRLFVEFNYHNKVKALDLILSMKSILNTKSEGLIYVERSIAILSSDENGIPLYGFCCVNKIKEPKGTSIDKNNFRIISTSHNTDLSKKLEGYLTQTAQ